MRTHTSWSSCSACPPPKKKLKRYCFHAQRKILRGLTLWASSDSCAVAVQMVFSVYIFFSIRWRYFGIGSWDRPSFPGHPGLAKRLWEHLFAAYRPKHPEAKKLRCTLCRNTPVERVFFMICHTDTEQVIRALEILEIRTHRPEANGQPVKQQP